MEDANNKTTFWESMVSKYQQKNTRLRQQQCEIQHHLEAMECAMPAILARNKDLGGNQPDVSKLMSQIGKVNVNKNDNSSASVSAECACGACVAKRIDGSCPCDQQAENQQTTSNDDCSCTECFDSEDTSLSSLQSADAEYMKKLQELADREKQMKIQIQEMLQREQVYMETLHQADEMWACMESCCKQHLSDVQQSGDSERAKYERLSEQLMEENTRLSDELKDVKLDLKQCMERLEGPVSRELDKEKRRSQQLENELLSSKQTFAKKDEMYLKDMTALQSQLNATCTDMCKLTAANEEMRMEMQVLKCKYKDLQTELINQKITEGLTLQKMQEMLHMERDGDENDDEPKEEDCECD